MSDAVARPPQVIRPGSVARALRHPIRRAVLATAIAADDQIAISQLEAVVRERGSAYGVDDLPRARKLREGIHHRHLPVLVLSDLLARRQGGRAVAPGTHRLLSHPAVDAAWLRDDGANWAALGAVFGQPRRRTAVRLLADATLPLGLDPLARAVVAERAGEIAADAPAVADMATRLHHVGLPLLDNADVLRYDADNRRVLALSEPDLPLPVEGF